MPEFNPPKQRGLNLAVCLFLFVFNYTNCYSYNIVPRLDGSTETFEGWTLNSLKRNSDCWVMNNPNSSIETAEFYDFSTFTDITITYKIGTYNTPASCTTNLEISDDGINWTMLKQLTQLKTNSTGTSSSYYIAILPNKHAKIRIVAVNSDNSSGAKLFTLEITGTQQFIPTPIVNEAKEISTKSFIANWNSCKNATDYEINIYNKLPGKAERAILNEDFSEQVKYDGCIDTELSTYLPKWGGKYIYFIAPAAENQKFIKVGQTSTKGGYIETPPLNLSGNNGKFELNFDIGTMGASQCNVYLYINNAKVKTILISTTKSLYPSRHLTYSFDNGTENCKIKLEGVTTGAYAFIMDNLVVTQTLDGVETPIAGYPKSIGNNASYTVEGLAPNTTYYYTIKATNGNVTANKSNEVCVKTLPGEQIVIAPNEEKIFNNETINGDLCINDGAKISGKVTITGEISYICKFTPGKWHSFSLPFIPRNVGGYINGKAHSLRANYDYMLKNYQNETFTDTTLGNRGYIIKILSNIDNGELLFFSDKGITLNEGTSQYTIDYGYTHLGNPYTYNIDPKVLVSGDKYYSLRNNKFIESEDELLPFQSFIVFKGLEHMQSMRAISTDPEIVDVQPLKNEKAKIWQDGKSLWITGTKGPINVYSAQGKLIFTGSIEDNKPIPLTTGFYLVRTENLTTKIIIK